MEKIQFISRVISDHSELIGTGLFAAVAWQQVRNRNLKHRKAKKLLQKAIDTQSAEPFTLHPEVDPALCAGCGACTTVCPEGDVLKLIDHKAVLVSPTKCVGHGECELACPVNAITLVFGTKARGMDIARISSDFETNVPGLYISGELGGMGLIRNAVKQGSLAAKHALSNLASEVPETDVDLLVVGAGPAGLAASLTAIAERKRYLCIEQNTFGGTVYNFPRQKIVMSYPADLPVVGKMQFKKNKVTKEELLEFWDGVRKKTGLQIQEQTKFDKLEKVDGIFHVETNKGKIRAQKVILAMGVRGSPRRLGLANEDLPKVTYNLIDPEQYQDQDVAVVGGGNAAVEAAQYLANPKLRNRVTLLVRGPTFDRCNDDNKAIIEQMESQGQVAIWYKSSLKEIQPDQIVTTHGEETKTIPNTFIFVFAGAESPHKFLMSLGIEIDKKFGDPPGKVN